MEQKTPDSDTPIAETGGGAGGKWRIRLIAVLTVAVVVIAIAFWTGIRAQGYETVTVDGVFNPDGLTVYPVNGEDDQAQVKITAIPREAFLNGDGGAAALQARNVLPETILPISPLYTVRMRRAEKVTAEMVLPNGADPLSRLAIYRWDEALARWVFVPIIYDAARQMIVFDITQSPAYVMAVHVTPPSPAVGLMVEEDGSAPVPDYGLVFPRGAAIAETGDLIWTPVISDAAVVIPVVENQRGGFTAYDDAALADRYIEEIAIFVAPYSGIAIDFAISGGFSPFVEALAENLHSAGKRLDMILRQEDLQAVDLPALRAYVDGFWVMGGSDPDAYLAGGAVHTMLEYVTRVVEREHVGLIVDVSPVDIVGESIRVITVAEATTLFGRLDVVDGYIDPTDMTVPVNQEVPLRFSGKIESLGYDDARGMNYLTYRDSLGAIHHVYFPSGYSVRQQLEWARDYAIGGVSISGLENHLFPEDVMEGARAFLNQQPVDPPDELFVIWQVVTPAGAEQIAAGTGQAAIQVMWQGAEIPGPASISALLRIGMVEALLGEISLQVIDN
nr:hypothetical protein [Anaerolineae bacterium]